MYRPIKQSNDADPSPPCAPPVRRRVLTVALFALVVALSLLAESLRLWTISRGLPRCILVAENDHGHGGLGDYVKLTYRSVIVARAAGCAYRTARWSSDHGYDPAGFFSDVPAGQLVNERVCEVSERVSGDLSSETGDFCAIASAVNESKPECGVYRYPRENKHTIDFKYLQCAGDHYRRAFLGRPDARILASGCDKYAVLHRRAGDLEGSSACNGRVASPSTLNAAAEIIRARHPEIAGECYFVLTEGVRTPTVASLDFPHRVLSDQPADVVLATMAHATVLFGSGSGLIHAATTLFEGETVFVLQSSVPAFEALVDGRFNVSGVPNLCDKDRGIINL